MMKYSLGGFFTHFEFLKVLVEEKAANPWIYNDDFVLESVYDSFPNVIFNGGRPFIQPRFKPGEKGEELEAIIRFYNDRGVGVRYTYSNSLIREEHLADPYANLTLELAHNPLNGVIVNNPILEAYIKKHYPKYKIIISTTAQNFDPEWYKRRREEVDIIVLPVEWNYDEEKVKLVGTDKVEIMVNEGCAAYCPFKKEHYAAASRDQLSLRLEGQESLAFFTRCCPMREGTPLWESNYRKDHPPVRLGLDQMRQVHADWGVEHFKIICRSLPIKLFYEQVERYFLKRSQLRSSRLPSLMVELNNRQAEAQRLEAAAMAQARP